MFCFFRVRGSLRGKISKTLNECSNRSVSNLQKGESHMENTKDYTEYVERMKQIRILSTPDLK